MCGFAGVVYTDPRRPPDADGLARAGETLAHRGPDDDGIWQGPGAGFVHRRLSILDLSDAGHQPCLVGDGRYALVYNGEVYNFREIRRALEKEGDNFISECDTEVVAKALARWGVKALDRFNGMFALAFYDTHERTLLLARDRLGIKPLFYSVQPDGLYFASELRALSHGFDLPLSIDPAALDSYFTYLYIPAPETIYREAKQLSPAHTLRLRDGHVEDSCYWTVNVQARTDISLDDAAVRFRDELKRSVRLRQISNVPLGAFLSGGVDSTVVATTLAELSTAPIKTFTIGFDDVEADELIYARAVALRLGSDHTEAILKPDMIDLLPKIQRHFGQPFADSSALPMWLLSQVAREAVTVALSGDGGDELFAGYTWAHMHHRVNDYRRVPAALRKILDAGLHLLPDSPRWSRYKNFSRDSFLSDREGFRRRQTCLDPATRQSLLRQHETPPDRFAEWADACAALSPDDRMLYIDLHQYLPDDILTKVDRMSMAHGLEARVPLLDHELVEFAAALPFSHKFSQGESKRIMKRAFAADFPPELQQQRKRGFSIPIHRWFRESLADHYHDRVLQPNALVAEWINQDTAATLLDQHLKHRANNGHALWAILSLAVWLDGENARQTPQ